MRYPPFVEMVHAHASDARVERAAKTNWRQQLVGVPVRIVSHAHAAHIGRIGPIKEIHGTVAVIDFTTPNQIELVHVDLRGLLLLPKSPPVNKSSITAPKRRTLSLNLGARA